MSLDLEAAARIAERAADAARAETLTRFRAVEVETKGDGSPVTEADRAAERAMREVLRGAVDGAGILGEEYGAEDTDGGRHWVIDPIDGTIGFSRGIPLFTTLIALVEDGEPVLGLIDCPAVDERYLGWKGGGCRRNGVPTRVTDETDLRKVIVSHGDPFCFDLSLEKPAFERMAAELPLLRGYTDAFGHAQVLGGGVGAMVDLQVNLWDVAPTQALIGEAGGRCVTWEVNGGKLGIVFGAPALIDPLLAYLESAPR